MTSPNKTYRICCFDSTHHIVTQDWIQAASDEDAIAKAEAMGFGTQCEIWDGHRLIASLEARAA
jgi:hypothetical protein